MGAHIHMKKTQKTKILSGPGFAFLGVVIVVLVVLFAWRNNRVDTILENSSRGDTINVGTDVCEVLRTRHFIATDTNCGYRQTVEVKLVRDPK